MVVTDLTEQACAIGDLHHAIEARPLSRADVHAELGETGTGLQDAAAAAAVHRRTLEQHTGTPFPLYD